MLSFAQNIDIYKKRIGLQESKPVIMNCIATAFKIYTMNQKRTTYSNAENF